MRRFLVEAGAETKQNHIGGKWTTALSGRTRGVVNPATGEMFALAVDSSRTDAPKAIDTTRESFYSAGEWQRMNTQKRLAERANALRLGNTEHNPDMCLLPSKAQMERVLRYIKTSKKKEDATFVYGGNRYTEGECAKSFFVHPIMFDNCAPSMTVVREEIFGPVVTAHGRFG